MKFSILIANYNNGKYFKTCFDSIITQTYSNWEVVILDDASTDDSLELINNLTAKDARFKIYKNHQNSGVGVTKSKLIDFAMGDICGFVDPDDAILPNALSSAINAYLTKKNTVLTYSKYIKCDENLEAVEVPANPMQVRNADPYFFNCPVHIVHFVSFKKSVYETTEKINVEMKIAEDQDLYLKMYEKGDVTFIDEALYLYRIHSGGISQNENHIKSKDYFAQVILSAMKRRNLNKINGKTIPEKYTKPDEIYKLLAYQNSIFHRVEKKVRIFKQQLFS